MTLDHQPAIEVLEESDPQREAALRVILALPGEGPGHTQDRVDRLVHYVEKQSLRMSTVLGAKLGGRLLSAVLLIESPGRLGAAFIPTGTANDGRRHATRLLLQRLPQHAWDSSLVLVQALVEQEIRSDADLFAEAGFGHLADLLYMERPAQAGRPTVPAIDGLEFVTHSPDRHNLFLDVLEQTYRDSLDCPKLSGIRRPEEVLATHRATGVYDPQGWFVVLHQKRPAGVLILAGAHDRPAFEVVYMGVVPHARGAGIGDAILDQALKYCDRHGQADLTLAVDERNEPALRLYRRWGMRDTTRRSAWFIHNPQRTA